MDLRQHLIDAGAHPLDVSMAESEGDGALRAFAFEWLLFPGRRHTPAEAWEQSGVDPEFGRALWRAMGFAAIPDDVAALTEADIEALRQTGDLFQLEVVTRDTVLRTTRLIGQAMSRISDALIAEFRGNMALRSDLAGTQEKVDDLLPFSNLVLLPTIDAELTYILHRHLVDAAKRQLRTADEGTPQRTLAVGFADLVNFTEVSQRIDEYELQTLIDRFESTTSAIVTGVGGQTVKLIGDEVLFTTDEPGAAVDAALALVQAFSDDDVPDVRVGVAYGTVLVHQGDVFGPVVNLASRAVGVANPGAVLIDEASAEHLVEHEDLWITPIRPRTLKGIGRTKLHLVREATVAEEHDVNLDYVPTGDPTGGFGRARRRALGRLRKVE